LFEDQCRSYSDGNLIGQKDCKHREDPCSSPPHIGEVCLRLLTRLVAYTSTANGTSSSEVRMWLSSESCSSSMESLLPLVFHPCPSMRREIAVLLAFMPFSSDVLISSLEELGTSRDRQLKSNFTTLLAATSPQSPKDPKCLCNFELFVPLPFLHWYRFPCKVVGVKLCHSGNQCLDFPVDDELVCRMVTQMQLLEGELEMPKKWPVSRNIELTEGHYG
jgi:hypothetical protein